MGYYHIPMDEYSKALLGTIMPGGYYQYQVLAMGISNAPDIFQSIRPVTNDAPRPNAHELARIFRARIPSYTPANATAPASGACSHSSQSCHFMSRRPNNGEELDDEDCNNSLLRGWKVDFIRLKVQGIS